MDHQQGILLLRRWIYFGCKNRDSTKSIFRIKYEMNLLNVSKVYYESYPVIQIMIVQMNYCRDATPGIQNKQIDN